MFTLREAAALIPGAVVIGDENVAFDRVSTDSRTAGPGDLFVAIKGDRFDAHDFLPQVAAARRRGGAGDARACTMCRVPAIKVKDTRVALGALAHGWRKRFTMPLVAVTGSNGKTTVKEMIASIFAAAVGEAARLATAGNFNNDIGLPLTLFRLNETHQLAVVELGMNHPGETEVLGEDRRADGRGRQQRAARASGIHGDGGSGRAGTRVGDSRARVGTARPCSPPTMPTRASGASPRPAIRSSISR